MSDQNRISPYNINIKQTSNKNKEKCKLGGLLVDPIPNSPIKYRKKKLNGRQQGVLLIKILRVKGSKIIVSTVEGC